ncbi:MAG TPA: hypothetical protein VL263_02335 [Vicinamibacterales bacterium]|nr:hypothetical protein [Vicinamibacterales bacterium]
MRARGLFAIVAIGLTASLASAVAQRPGAFGGARDVPAIAYSTAPVNDAVAALDRKLASGAATLAFDSSGSGYLRAVLDALKVPVSSQMLAFAETSLQASKIRRDNPRAVYYNDTVSVAWIRGSDLLELAAQDPKQGVIFYTLTQAPGAAPRFERNDTCLACHLSWDTLAVPGYVLQTVFPRVSDRDYAEGGFVDDRTPIEDRWGGWFVTGSQVPARHKGNQPTLQPKLRSGPAQKLATVQGEIDTSGYLTPHSDVTALLVFDHQVHAANLLTRLNWEARAGTPATVEEAVSDLVDYLLFVDEAPVPGRVAGTSGFAAAFMAEGPRDSKGRSLRDLKLEGRLMQFPLSYMIYTPMFDALPDAAGTRVRKRLAAVLTGADTRPKYAHLTPSLRTAITEILRDTRPGLLPGI